MDQIYCTLFDSNYMDKGLVLYDSMCDFIGDFKLYIFAFDDLCYSILSKMHLKNATLIPLKDLETEELLKAKQERTPAEYCWTCAAWTIKHVLDCFQEDICTYIDADMMFFSSPQPIFDDLRAKECSIIIVPHRFKNEKEERKAHDTVGSYCVEFNTFINNEQGRAALDWWADRCLEWCFYAVPGTTEWYGDQKYLNVFPQKFKGVYICDHIGIGLAPWNNMLVDYVKDCPLKIKEKKSGKVFPLILYHFENVSFLSRHILHVSSGLKSKELHKCIYDEYVDRILKKRRLLKEEHGFAVPKNRRIVTRNVFMKIYQTYIGPLKRIKRISDLYWIKEE
ncbi:glycosyl transferase [bacterium D16-50]|nr:glycosyl transferase [bacterium D16-50]